MTGLPSPYQPANANSVVERFMGSLRREALNHFLILSERHVADMVSEYVIFYNTCRPHQGIDDIPGWKSVGRARAPPVCEPGADRLVGRPVLGGVQHDYRLVA